MSRSSTLLAAIAAVFFVACAEETTSTERGNAAPPSNDGGSNEASTREGGEPDPEDGRDTEPASCYAACSNTSFTCGALVASVTPDAAGCTGTIAPAGGGAPKTLKLECGARRVCIDGACVDGRFNAVTFAYTPSGGTQVICTRD